MVNLPRGCQSEKPTSINQRTVSSAVTKGFFLFGTDVTPALRPYAPKLEDKGIVYQPTTTPGNKPIGVGHTHSLLACLPEKQSASPWRSNAWARKTKTMKWASIIGQTTCAVVGDSSYFVPNNPPSVEAKENLILISRMKSNRNVHERYEGAGNKK